MKKRKKPMHYEPRNSCIGFSIINLYRKVLDMKSSPKNVHQASLKSLSDICEAIDELESVARKAYYQTILVERHINDLLSPGVRFSAPGSDPAIKELVAITADEQGLAVTLVAEAQDSARATKMMVCDLNEALSAYRSNFAEATSCERVDGCLPQVFDVICRCAKQTDENAENSLKALHNAYLDAREAADLNCSILDIIDDLPAAALFVNDFRHQVDVSLDVMDGAAKALLGHRCTGMDEVQEKARILISDSSLRINRSDAFELLLGAMA